MSIQRMYEAKETVYCGTVFRSRLEAKWAGHLDAHGVEWAYEPNLFRIERGKHGRCGYLPDFWLPSQGCWLEVKPEMIEPDSIEYYKANHVRKVSAPVLVTAGGPEDAGLLLARGTVRRHHVDDYMVSTTGRYDRVGSFAPYRPSGYGLGDGILGFLVNDARLDAGDLALHLGSTDPLYWTAHSDWAPGRWNGWGTYA